MTAKEYLRQLRRLDRQLELLFREREELERAQTFLRSPQIEGDRVQTSPSGDPPWMGYLIKWEEMTNRIGEKWNELIEQKKVIVSQINDLTDSRYIDLLTKRYVEYKSFEKIAVEMNYTYDHVRRLHGWALQAFKQKMPQNVT